MGTSQGLLAATRSWERQEIIHPKVCVGSMTLLTRGFGPMDTDFRLLAFGSVREWISVILSHWLYGNLGQQPQEMNTGT